MRSMSSCVDQTFCQMSISPLRHQETFQFGISRSDLDWRTSCVQRCHKISNRIKKLSAILLSILKRSPLQVRQDFTRVITKGRTEIKALPEGNKRMG